MGEKQQDERTNASPSLLKRKDKHDPQMKQKFVSVILPQRERVMEEGVEEENVGEGWREEKGLKVFLTAGKSASPSAKPGTLPL